jgi:hypothetical protein
MVVLTVVYTGQGVCVLEPATGECSKQSKQWRELNWESRTGDIEDGTTSFALRQVVLPKLLAKSDY